MKSAILVTNDDYHNRPSIFEFQNELKKCKLNLEFFDSIFDNYINDVMSYLLE